MKKISLILLIPFGSLIGISILFNVYNDYLKMAASQYNYDYLYICLFRLLEALILFISILVYMKDIQKEDNKLIYLIEGVQIISFIMIIIISSFMVINDIHYAIYLEDACEGVYIVEPIILYDYKPNGELVDKDTKEILTGILETTQRLNTYNCTKVLLEQL